MLPNVYATFKEICMERVCKVLLEHSVFFVVEPVPDGEYRVYVKDDAADILGDLTYLSSQQYPFTLKIDVDQEQYDYASRALPWFSKDGKGMEVEPWEIIIRLSTQVPLDGNGEYFLEVARDARRRGVEYLRLEGRE